MTQGGKWICVPNLKHIKQYQDVQAFKVPILMVLYKARCHIIRSTMRHLPASKGRTLETSRITVTSEDPTMEMGRNRKGFHSWVTSYVGWI
jgi:hypothetical protein